MPVPLETTDRCGITVAVSERLPKRAGYLNHQAVWRASFWQARPSATPPLIACGVLIGIVAIVYANSLQAPLIYDDFGVVRDNATIRHLWPLEQPLSPPRTGNPMSGRPIVNLTMAINYAIDGVHPR